MEGFSSLDMVEVEMRRGEVKGSGRRRHGRAREAWCENRQGKGWNDRAWRQGEAVLQFWCKEWHDRA